MATKKPEKLSNRDIERIGRLVIAIGESGHVNKKRLYTASFLRGIFAGVGSVIGATIVVALLLLILSLLSEIPFIGSIADNLEQTIDNR